VKGGMNMSEIRNIYLNENGELMLAKDIISILNLHGDSVECIIDSDQIILRSPVSVLEQLFGCWGEESKEDYRFHIELELFGGLDHACD